MCSGLTTICPEGTRRMIPCSEIQPFRVWNRKRLCSERARLRFATVENPSVRVASRIYGFLELRDRIEKLVLVRVDAI